jgi:plastocyanin
MATRRQPLMNANPGLFFGVMIFLVCLVGGGAAMYAGTQLVGGEQAAVEAEADGVVTTPGGPVNTTLVARNLTFDKRSIAASPGVDVTVKLDNQDAGVLHNVAFYTNRSASTKIFVGATSTGPASTNETFKAPTTPGNYFFRCDAHPDQMTGSFVVK